MQGTGATDYYTQVGREIEAFLSKTKSLDDALDGMVAAYEEITETRYISCGRWPTGCRSSWWSAR